MLHISGLSILLFLYSGDAFAQNSELSLSSVPMVFLPAAPLDKPLSAQRDIPIVPLPPLVGPKQVPDLSEDQPELDIFETPLPGISSPIQMPLVGASVEHARVSQFGISLTKGASAVMWYNVRVRAIHASVMAQADREFVSLLSATEIEAYAALKRQYRGGFNVPFLRMLGMSLDGRFSEADVFKKGRSLISFRKKMSVARKILDSTTEEKIRIKGKLKAKGVSCVQTKVYAFIKLSNVELADGTNRTVISSDSSDLEAATKHGDVVVPSKGSLGVYRL